MSTHDAARAIARVIAARPGLPGVHVYAHDLEIFPDGSENKVIELELPAVLVRVKGNSLSGSDTIEKVSIEIDVESQVDDSSMEEHAIREKEVRAAMADQGALLSSFQAIGTTSLLGKIAKTSNDPETQDRAFKTPFTYVAGISS